jgi:hypothetical protein
MNLHMRHLEDLALGTPEETRVLSRILSAVEQNSIEISEKIDGAPSFVFGIDGESRPFMCYKSHINKPFYSKEEIEQSTLPCKHKLSAVWNDLITIAMDAEIVGQAWQCDLIAHDASCFTKEGDFYVATPNLIGYRFVNPSRTTIAPHTRYDWDHHSSSWFTNFDNRFVFSTWAACTRVVQNIIPLDHVYASCPLWKLKANNAIDRFYSMPVEDEFSKVVSKYNLQDDVEFSLNRLGQREDLHADRILHQFLELLIERISDRTMKESGRLKKESSRQAKLALGMEIVYAIERTEFMMAVSRRLDLYLILFYLKSQLLQNRRLLSTVPTVQDGEGFVLRIGNAAAKVVDRPHFSRLNSDTSTKKGWQSNDEADIQNTTPTESDDQ